MSYYSSNADQTREVMKLGRDAFRLWDGDGNFYSAFVVPAGMSPQGLTPQYPIQSIPPTMKMAEIYYRVDRGDLVESLFGKGMDARVPRRPHDIVDILNKDVKEERWFSNAILTSRPRGEVVELMDRSGIKRPDLITMVGDSGAVKQVAGVVTVIRTLMTEEKQLVEAVKQSIGEMNRIAKAVANDLGFHAPEPKFPRLVEQEKAIGVGYDWRNITDYFGEPEGSRLDKALGKALTDHLAGFSAFSPLDTRTGKAALGTLGGPCNVDFRVLSVDKGQGMEALVTDAMAGMKKPTGLFFGGDNLANGPADPGTDYYGAIKLPVLARRHNLPFTLLHTHHPIDRDLSSRTPNPQLAPAILGAGFETVRPHLVLPTPREVSGLFARFAAYNAPRSGLAATLGTGPSPSRKPRATPD